MHIHTNIHTYTHSYTHTHRHPSIHPTTTTHTHTHIHTHTHTTIQASTQQQHTHTHTHTHIHTHTPPFKHPPKKTYIYTHTPQVEQAIQASNAPSMSLSSHTHTPADLRLYPDPSLNAPIHPYQMHTQNMYQTRDALATSDLVYMAGSPSGAVTPSLAATGPFLSLSNGQPLSPAQRAGAVNGLGSNAWAL